MATSTEQATEIRTKLTKIMGYRINCRQWKGSMKGMYAITMHGQLYINNHVGLRIAIEKIGGKIIYHSTYSFDIIIAEVPGEKLDVQISA